MNPLTDLADLIAAITKAAIVIVAQVAVIAVIVAMTLSVLDLPDPKDAQWPATGFGWLVLHLASCKRRPGKRCWRSQCPKRRPRDEDEHGHYQYRRNCWACGSGDRHRFGARLIRAKVRKS